MSEVEVSLEIQKEAIPNLKFSRTEAIYEPLERKLLRDKLFKAMILGNGYKKKVRIHFLTIEGERFVETTIWVASDQNIILKGGIFIPIRCIRDVDFI